MWKKLQELWKSLQNRKDWLGILYRILVVLTFPVWGILLIVLKIGAAFIVFPIIWLFEYILTGESSWGKVLGE